MTGSFFFSIEAKDGSIGFDFEGTSTEIELQNKIVFALENDRKVEILFSAVIYAFFLTSFAGILDEFIQFFLPNRFFDYLDIIRNAGAAFIGIGINFRMSGISKYRSDL